MDFEDAFEDGAGDGEEAGFGNADMFMFGMDSQEA